MSGGKLFGKKYVGKVGKHAMCHGKLEVLFRHVASDPSEGGVAVFACSEANGNGGKTSDLTEVDVAGQSVLLNVPGEICENYVARVPCL